MSFGIGTRPLQVRVGGGTIKNGGPDTLYYAASSNVSASTNDGSLASGSTAELLGSQWIVSAGSSAVDVIPSRRDTPAGHSAFGFTATSGRSMDVNCAGATVTNDGPGTLYYRDRSPVSTTTYDGSIAAGSATVLNDVQWFTSDTTASARLTAVRVAQELPVKVSDLVEPWMFWHRGAGVLSEDDSLRALDVANGYGAVARLGILDGGDWRATSDGSLVSMHDSTTGRTCTTNVTVSSTSDSAWAALRLSARQPGLPTTEGPPFVADVLDRLVSMGAAFSPEIKTTGIAQTSANMIAARGLQKRCLFSSGTLSDLTPAQAAGIPTMYFADQSPDTAANVVAAAPMYMGFDYNSAAVTDVYLQTVGAAGIKLLAYTIDSRSDLASVQTRLSGLGLTLSAWASNDIPWVANLNVPPAQMTDPYALGIWRPGMAPGQPYHQTPMAARGTFTGSAGSYRLQLDDTANSQWMLQGWAVQTLSASSSITVTITYDAIGTDTTSWAGVAFDCPTDLNYFTGATAQNRGTAYVVILRANGSLGLFKTNASGTANSSLATAVTTTAISAGGTATLKIEPNLPGNVVKVTRVDTAQSIQATDSSFRGGYFHFGKGQNGTGFLPSFSNVTVVP